MLLLRQFMLNPFSRTIQPLFNWTFKVNETYIYFTFFIIEQIIDFRICLWNVVGINKRSVMSKLLKCLNLNFSDNFQCSAINWYHHINVSNQTSASSASSVVPIKVKTAYLCVWRVFVNFRFDIIVVPILYPLHSFWF